MAIRSREIVDPIKPALLAVLRAQLAEGERLAWAASPQPATPEPENPSSGKLDAAVILGGGYATLGSCGMALFTGRWLWLAVPIVLLLLGLAGYLVARWIEARAKRSDEGTIYGFTTRRGLVVHTYPKLAVTSLAIAEVADVTVIDQRAEWQSLEVRSRAPAKSLIFQRVSEPERACTQLLRVIRDPQATEQEIAAAETYATQMRQLMVRSIPN